MAQFTQDKLNEFQQLLKQQYPKKEVVLSCIENGEAIFGVYNLDAARHHGGLPVFYAISQNLAIREIIGFRNRARYTVMLPSIKE